MDKKYEKYELRRKYTPIKFKLGEFNIYYLLTINF